MVKRIGDEAAPEPATERANHLVTDLAIAAAVTVGPFLTAFCTQLGTRFGGTAADWASRVRTRLKAGAQDADAIEVEAFGRVTIVELTEPLTDDARLALLDLDISRADICGQTLRWNPATAAWEVVSA